MVAPKSTRQGTGVTGPATGGILAINLCQKRIGIGTPRTEDRVWALADMRLITALWHDLKDTAADAANASLDGTVQCVAQTTAVPRIVYRNASSRNKRSGETSGNFDEDWHSDNPDRNVTRNNTVTMAITGDSTSAFGYACTLIMAVHGHPYDPQNNIADYPYTSDDD